MPLWASDPMAIFEANLASRTKWRHSAQRIGKSLILEACLGIMQNPNDGLRRLGGVALALIGRILTGGTALGISVALCMIAGEAQASMTEITCTNQTSGASWLIRIDYDRQTVDSNPASISNDEIAWHDKADGGNYTLDRKSGKLTVIFASSTAGHFLYHHCKLEH